VRLLYAIVQTKVILNIRSIFVGQQQIEIVDQYTHPGTTCDNYLSTHLLIQEACRRLRATFLSICNSGIHPGNLNPLTSRTIYKYVVIPKALYGCEMWSNTVLQYSADEWEFNKLLISQWFAHGTNCVFLTSSRINR